MSCNYHIKLDVDPQRDDDASPMSTYRWDLFECWFQLFSTKSIQFRTSLKKNQIFGSHVVVLEDLSVEVSITNVGLILTKLWWFQLFVESQNSNFFGKKIQILGFPWCSTREGLSIDVSITNVGLILTKPERFLFSAYGNSGYGQNSISLISNFLKKIHIFGFPWYSTCEDHSIDVSITNVGLILTKLRWFQLFVKNQKSNFFEKIKF